MSTDETFDVAVVGASIAGSTAAALYGRQGASVALIERDPDPAAYKTVCTTYIQASAVPVLERLGVVPDLEAAGAVHNDFRIWTQWGWIQPHFDPGYRRIRNGYNVRRETLDPMLRAVAARTDGVELMLGATATDVVQEDGRTTGVVIRDRSGTQRTVRARIIVGADGRDSRMAKFARVPGRRRPNGRFAYFAHYRGIELAHGGSQQMWMLFPDMVYSFRMNDDVTILAAMPAADKLPAWRADPGTALHDIYADLPEGPSLENATRVSKVIGKLDMSGFSRPPARPGLAFVGDAAMVSDPLWGVGCGFALQSAEWLVDATGDAARHGHGVDEALRHYARKHRRALTGHHFMMNDFATGRAMNPIERTIFAAAARDNQMACHLHDFGTRQIGPARFLSPRALARAGWVNARHHGRSRVQGSVRPSAAITSE